MSKRETLTTYDDDDTSVTYHRDTDGWWVCGTRRTRLHDYLFVRALCSKCGTLIISDKAYLFPPVLCHKCKTKETIPCED